MQSLSSYLPLGAKRPLAHAASRVRSTQDVQALPYRVIRIQLIWDARSTPGHSVRPLPATAPSAWP